jgi:hypothetical protein
MQSQSTELSGQACPEGDLTVWNQGLVGDFAAFDRLLRAQVYARRRFQGLNCSSAQLCAELLSKGGRRRGFVGLMVARASLVSFPAPIRPKTGESATNITPNEMKRFAVMVISH